MLSEKKLGESEKEPTQTVGSGGPNVHGPWPLGLIRSISSAYSG